MDAVILPSPYAFAFGGFVEFLSTVWFALGGVITTLVEVWAATSKSKARAFENSGGGEVPADMNATSLIGGGLIGGDSLAALCIGLYGLLKTLL